VPHDSSGAFPLQRNMMSTITSRDSGSFGSADYRLTFFNGDKKVTIYNFRHCVLKVRVIQISPWHDIPLKDSSGHYNFLTEVITLCFSCKCTSNMFQIPKFGKHKMEVMGKEPLNPIAQDIKNGNPRLYHGPIFWNYGCIPQTWEDPSVRDPNTNTCGDKYVLLLHVAWREKCNLSALFAQRPDRCGGNRKHSTPFGFYY
jgi:hypothetical protein